MDDMADTGIELSFTNVGEVSGSFIAHPFLANVIVMTTVGDTEIGFSTEGIPDFADVCMTLFIDHKVGEITMPGVPWDADADAIRLSQPGQYELAVLFRRATDGHVVSKAFPIIRPVRIPA